MNHLAEAAPVITVTNLIKQFGRFFSRARREGSRRETNHIFG